MPPIDLNPIRAHRAADQRLLRAESLAGRTGGAAAQAGPQVELDPALATAHPPIDQQRVAEIRKAIEQGRYPITPMRVADALIAAGYLWRAPK
ncbi:MAG: flagellar biosynthesis anti-sigma factor FlgM [Novosphingobium sp.]|jgi:negative regulator of flagellin synthesis FlgM|nr:flagellar biosynthesis anti-sigma factor FlgM [Novosphingobium sp.]